MKDLELAKDQLYKKNLTLAIVKNGKLLYETDSHRISGFISAIEKFNSELQGASVADRVAGKAIALLCVYSGIGYVYAEVLSKKAEAVFEENGVCYEWKKLVDNILDMKRAGACPFEKLAADISDPEESYPKFKALLEKMKTCK
jgi:hypothetical protein